MLMYVVLNPGGNPHLLPLFFPCGSIKREVLPTVLRENSEMRFITDMSSFIHHQTLIYYWLVDVSHVFVSLTDVPLETLTVYQTSEHPDLQKNITDYFSQQVQIFGCFLAVRVFAGSDPSVCVSPGRSCKRGVL